MRHIQHITFILVTSLLSSVGMAADPCGFENTEVGKRLKEYYVLSVGLNKCEKRISNYFPIYQKLRSDKAVEYSLLHQKAESFFKKAISNSSCRSALGDLGGREERGALDKWVTQQGNANSLASDNNAVAFCEKAKLLLEKETSKSLSPVKIQKIQSKLKPIIREYESDEIRPEIKEMQRAESKVALLRATPSVSYRAQIRSSTSGTIASPLSLAYSNRYAQLWPSQLPSVPQYTYMNPSFVFVPGVGYLPNQQANVLFVHSKPMLGAK